jgi:enterochelin esterase-like enzyme
MAAKRLSRMAWLVLISISISSIPSFASDIGLAVGEAREGRVSAGRPQSFVILFNSEDYAEIKIDPRGKQLAVILYDPSGSKFRGGTIGPGEDRSGFTVEGPGAYRLEVAGSDKTIEGTFTITLEKIVPLAARLARPKPLLESPRIQALRASLESGKPGTIDAFWREVQKEGAPIIEPLAGDHDNMLVTFLWRGTPDTHNVFVARLPYAAATPDDYFMNRLDQSDVWYKTFAISRKARFEYSLAPNVPKLQAISFGIDNEAIAMIAAAARTDPLNPNLWRLDKRSLDSPEYQGRSIVEMPDAPAQPWVVETPGVPAGHIEKRRFKSALLKNEREIAIYLPPGYSRNNKAYPLLVLFDELAYLGDPEGVVLVPTPTILNNLIAAKRIPPMVALLVDNAAGARDRELLCNPAFSDFLSSELLPWAHGLYSFTTDPRQTVVGGSSLGGMAATCAGFHHPETFGNILSQSGAYHRTPPKTEGAPGTDADSEPNWIAKKVIASAKQPLRFYLDAGSEEIDVTGGGSSILLTNRTLRDVLLAKGYEVHFQEFAGGHDYLSWRGTLADGLITLIGCATTNPGQEPTAVKP